MQQVLNEVSQIAQRLAGVIWQVLQFIWNWSVSNCQDGRDAFIPCVVEAVSSWSWRSAWLFSL